MDVLDKIQGIFSKSWIAIVAGFILGFILGLPILGWTIWPVKWVDTTPDTLRVEYKKDYIRMMVDSFAINSDRAVAEQIALQRWSMLGDDAGSLFIQLNGDAQINSQYYTEFSNIISTEVGDMSEESKAGEEVPQLEDGVAETSTQSDEFLLTAEAATGGLEGEDLTAGDESKDMATDEEASGLFGKLGLVILIFCALIVVVGGALAYLLFIRRKPNDSGTTNSSRSRYVNHEEVEFDEETVQDDEEPNFEEYLQNEQVNSSPIAQFITTYNLGDDLYDDSFSIDAPDPSGEFLGECGVGISDTIGSGDPKKVSAFEVWLFDKNDVQTVTKVLMAEDGFNNPDARQKLEPKGELVQVREGMSVVLDTTTLQLEARVIEYNYPADSQPHNSTIDRISLELSVWLKA